MFVYILIETHMVPLTLSTVNGINIDQDYCMSVLYWLTYSHAIS